MLARCRSLVAAAFCVGAITACGSDSTPPIVTARVDVTAPNASLIVGATEQLAAVARTSDGSAVTAATFTWTSDNVQVASVSASGLLTAVGAGSTTIHATSGGASGSVAITVTPQPVATVAIRADTSTFTIGDTRTLVVTVKDANGNDLTGRTVTFTSSDTSVATVRTGGVLTAVSPGSVTITAQSEGKSGTATFTVVRGALPHLALQLIASGVSGRFMSAPPGDSRLFLGTVDGRIFIIQNDQILPDPFLDLRDRVNKGVNGLYAFAFHPQYAKNGFIYVDYVDTLFNNRVERFTVSSDPNKVSTSTAQPIIEIDHPPPFDHYGGWMAFGPDGKLFISTGDGGAGDSENAQNKNLLLGKILRLDVDGGTPYAVPADNPFVGVANVKPEIWAYGLRNPFRDSFDRVTGTLYVADVGEDDWEEVNAVSPTRAGDDFGWNKLEATHCSPESTTGCSDPGSIVPVLEYSHPGRPGALTSTHPTGCSVTGGYVYRGNKLPALRGSYFYADFCAGWIRSFRLQNGVPVDAQQWFDNVGSIMSFAEDGAGELYVMTFEGKIYRIVPGP